MIAWNLIGAVLGVFVVVCFQMMAHVHFFKHISLCDDHLERDSLWVLCRTQPATHLCSSIFCGMQKGWYRSRFSTQENPQGFLQNVQQGVRNLHHKWKWKHTSRKFTFRCSQSVVCPMWFEGFPSTIPYRTKVECYCVSIGKVILQTLKSNTWSLLWDKTAV